MRKNLEELKSKMEQPGFWDNVEEANKVNKQIRPLEETLAKNEELQGKADELETMLLLAEEEGDDSLDAEIEALGEELKHEAEAFKLSALLNGPYDKSNAIVSLHAGAGGTEAQDWTSMLYRMYTRWAERRHFKVKILDFLEGEEAGVKSVTMLIEGLNAYGYLRSEKGVHRLVRISPFDSAARRHTSFSSVDVTPELAEETDFEINMDEVRIDTCLLYTSPSPRD